MGYNIREWEKEFDAAVKSQDVETFKTFYEKWRKKGYYKLWLPQDRVIEVSLRKMLYNLDSATAEEKRQAKEWLESRGFTATVL